MVLFVRFVRGLRAGLAIRVREVAFLVSLNRLNCWRQDYNFRLCVLHWLTSFHLLAAASLAS